MERPAGVQIYRWFVVLVALLVTVDVAALAGGFFVARSVRPIAAEAEPLAGAAMSIQSEILAAQRDLFGYFSEFAEDTAPALAHVDALLDRVVEARRIGTSPEVLAALDSIDVSAQKYRKGLDLLPHGIQGARERGRLQEHGARAVVELGVALEEGARRLASAARGEIRRKSSDAAAAVRSAVWGSVGVLVASTLAIAVLRHCWKRFQDVILGL